LKEYFTKQGAPEVFNKLLKEDINDAELFFKMGFDKIKTVCLDEIKQEGKKIKITKDLNEYFEKYKKDGSVVYLEAGIIEQPKVLLRKSTVADKNLKNFKEPLFFSSDEEGNSDNWLLITLY